MGVFESGDGPQLRAKPLFERGLTPDPADSSPRSRILRATSLWESVPPASASALLLPVSGDPHSRRALLPPLRQHGPRYRRQGHLSVSLPLLSSCEGNPSVPTVSKGIWTEGAG